MREEHRVSFRGFDGPQVVELDNEAVGFKKWGAGDLALIVESDWRTKNRCSARRDFVVQVISPFLTLRSQISGIKNPQVIASMNGGQRFIVSSSRKLIALKALIGIALIQSGTPRFAGTGGGSSPSSSAGSGI